MIKRFFLADDDEDDTNMFAEALKGIDASIQFDTAQNGRDLIDKLKHQKDFPNIIFLDINMPEMNGWEALEALKKEKALKDIHVIMYSTSLSSLEGNKAINNGALCFYEKPTNFLLLKDFLSTLSTSSPGDLKKTVKQIAATRRHRIYVQ
jgi:CheY-like chemotaxis protein